jgi:hypothetical protein
MLDHLRTSFFRGQQYELLEWLHKITFPTEERFKDVGFARKVYADVIRRVVSYGVGTNTPRNNAPVDISYRPPRAAITVPSTWRRQKSWRSRHMQLASGHSLECVVHMSSHSLLV